MSQRLICTVTTDLSYDQRMIRICNSLEQQGYSVLLLGRSLPDSLPLQAQAFEQKRLKCYFRKGKLFYLEFNLRLLWFLIRAPFHIVCAVDLDTLVPGFLVSRWKGKICVYDAHEYFTELPEVVDRPFTQWVWSQVAQWIIPRLKHAYTVGPQLAKLFEERYSTPFAVIRNLPLRQTDHIQPPIDRKEKIILYQGSLNAGRGLDTAIRAMHQLKDTQLWLAGEGDLSLHLRELVRAEKLDNKVKFLGYLSPEVLRTVTLQAHIGLNLLENSGLSYYYSLANKAFDYIQAGLPSVQMDFPEYRALEEQYQVFILLEKLEASALVTSIRRLLDEQEYWMEVHQNCLAVREALCWEEEEQILREFYRSLGSD